MSEEGTLPPGVKFNSDESDHHETSPSNTMSTVPPPLPPMRKRTKNYAKRREVRSMSSSYNDLAPHGLVGSVEEFVLSDVTNVDLLKPVVSCVHKKEGCQWADNLGKLKVRIHSASLFFFSK
jgi:hypothetical protein